MGARPWPSRAGALLATLTLATLGPALGAQAQSSAIVDLPGCTAAVIPNGDDDSSEAVALGFTANFFGRLYTSLYVNQNGNVSFDESVSTFTPFDLGASPVAIIAPFFADTDTSPEGSGQVTYGQTTVAGRPAFCVNWLRVGYYSNHTDKLNDVQLLLISRPGDRGDFDIQFNYGTIQWETGDASGGSEGLGGVSAAAGYSNGDGDTAHAFVQPGSLENGAFLDSAATGLVHHSRGTTQPGRYVFEVRNEKPDPELGTTVTVKTVKGTVLVRVPGSAEFVDVTVADDIPVGSVLDTTEGIVQLTSEQDTRGRTQTAQFSGALFRVSQGTRARGRTNLKLMGGSFGSCKKGSRRVIRRLRGATGTPKGQPVYGTGTRALATASRTRRRNRFRTSGRYAAATVRGTVWGTIDRCDGTVTWVKRGSVSVRDFVRKRTVTVRAGQRYLARARAR